MWAYEKLTTEVGSKLLNDLNTASAPAAEGESSRREPLKNTGGHANAAFSRACAYDLKPLFTYANAWPYRARGRAGPKLGSEHPAVSSSKRVGYLYVD